MPHPLDAHAFPPRGFCQTAAVQTVADQKSLLFIREEKQIVQQQSCPKCIKGVVRRRMRSLTGKLMALPPLLLTPEGNTEDSKALKAGIQALLRAQMISDFNKYSEKGYAPIYARDNFENCWKQYHSLGVNGVMDDLHRKFLELSTDPPEE